MVHKMADNTNMSPQCMTLTLKSFEVYTQPTCFSKKEYTQLVKVLHENPFDPFLRNRKHFPCFHTVIETRVEVWENEKLKWEHEPVGRVFPRNFEFSQTSTSVSITYGNTGKNVFYFVYKITRRKLKRGNSLLYQRVNSPYCS